MLEGWVTEDRAVLEHPVFQDAGLYRLFRYCILKANWKPGRWLVPGTMTQIDIDRGQFVTGRESLYAELYGPSYRGSHKPTSRTLWRWLSALQSLGCLKLETVSNRCTIVTVVNYSTYQDPRNPDVPHVSSTCPADVPHVSTIEQEKQLTLSLAQRPKIKIPQSWDTPRFWELIDLWRDHWFRVTGRKLDDIKLGFQLKTVGQYSPDRICRSIEKSIAKDAKSFLDPDEAPLSLSGRSSDIPAPKVKFFN